MQHIEDNEQMILIRWAQFESGKYPELSLLFHVPNGGKRNKVEAARFKAMGVQAGVPDLFLPVPRGTYHGLFIEMKAPKGRTSEAQNSWIEKLKNNGYAVEVCYGFEAAQKTLLSYLEEKYIVLQSIANKEV